MVGIFHVPVGTAPERDKNRTDTRVLDEAFEG